MYAVRLKKLRKQMKLTKQEGRENPAQIPSKIPETRGALTHNSFVLRDGYLHINAGGEPLTLEELSDVEKALDMVRQILKAEMH